MGPVADKAKKGFNRKIEKRRDARIADYQRTIDDPANRGKDMSGYRKPGSNKK